MSDSGAALRATRSEYFRKGVTTERAKATATVYISWPRAVHAYNGSIEIESNYPAGTVLKIVMQAAGPE